MAWPEVIARDITRTIPNCSAKKLSGTGCNSWRQVDSGSVKKNQLTIISGFCNGLYHGSSNHAFSNCARWCIMEVDDLRKLLDQIGIRDAILGSGRGSYSETLLAHLGTAKMQNICMDSHSTSTSNNGYPSRSSHAKRSLVPPLYWQPENSYALVHRLYVRQTNLDISGYLGGET